MRLWAMADDLSDTFTVGEWIADALVFCHYRKSSDELADEFRNEIKRGRIVLVK